MAPFTPLPTCAAGPAPAGSGVTSSAPACGLPAIACALHSWCSTPRKPVKAFSATARGSRSRSLLPPGLALAAAGAADTATGGGATCTAPVAGGMAPAALDMVMS
eukprot:45843-Chlamydomonas_euryale.AAC.2